MGAPAQRIVIAGASGLIGRALATRLRDRGARVERLVRRRVKAADEIAWDPQSGEIDSAKLEDALAVVNLAGEPIAARWTDARRQRIRDSRVLGTELLARTIAKLDDKPRVLVSGSAVGYYGRDRKDDVLDESSRAGDDFLARVCVDWERATRAASDAGVRVCHARTGVVLSSRGGALAKLLPLFRLGLGGQLGDGSQWMSWISLDDEVRALETMIDDARLVGAVNVVAPNAVTNAEFTRVLASVLHRPAFMRVPRFAMHLALGEMAEGTVFASQRVAPRALERVDFAFAHPELRAALDAALTA